MRGWSHEHTKAVSQGAEGTCGTDGARAQGRVSIEVAGDPVDLGEVRHIFGVARIWVRQYERDQGLTPGVSWQRCQVHFQRNACGLVPRSARKELAADLREVFAASDPESALRIAERTAEHWRARYPRAAKLIEDNIEDALAILALPSSHRQRLRTTNGLERLNQVIKRRTRVIRIFPNRESCLRLVTALAAEQSDEWVSGKCYLNMEDLMESKPETNSKDRTLVAIS